jgi:hypothetical protein
MIISSLDAIREQAHTLHEENLPWHFHILSPTCCFNENGTYAIILEGDSGDPLVCYSDKPEKELGAELSPLLHNPKSAEAQEQTITAEQQRILDAAKELNEHSTKWHHHVLFPGCMFNDQPGTFCLILENPETSETLKAMSDTEPRHMLKQLEPLFYKQ